MENLNAPLPHGYSPVPPGMLATVVTCLEMHEKPPVKADPPAGGLRLERWAAPNPESYRTLFRAVGEDWMWVSRLVMPDSELAAILEDQKVEVFVLTDGDRRLGLLELDFRHADECELAFFGLVPEVIGNGAGRLMMNLAIARAWANPISRFWVHTCHFDHPAALAFYQRSGFRPYASFVEVCEDPRRTGQMRADVAAHVPMMAAR